MFRLPIKLGGKAKSPARSGMSATSKRRVVTFLPPPLIAAKIAIDDARKVELEVGGNVDDLASGAHEEMGLNNDTRPMFEPQEPQLVPLSRDQHPDSDLGPRNPQPVTRPLHVTARNLDESLPISHFLSVTSPLPEDVSMVADTTAIVKKYPRTKLLIREVCCHFVRPSQFLIPLPTSSANAHVQTAGNGWDSPVVVWFIRIRILWTSRSTIYLLWFGG